MAISIRSAASAYVNYALESTFQTAGTTEILFGKEQKHDALEFTNNQQALGQLYTPEITDFLYNKNEGNGTMDYVLSNPWWLSTILNDPVRAGPASSIYTWTWDSDPAVNGNIRKPKTLTLNIGEAFSTPIVRQPLGVITPSITLRSAIDSPISVSHTLRWGKEGSPGTTLDSTLPSDSFTPYNFVNGTLELPSGTTIADLQDFDITFDTGADLLWGHGSADAVDAWTKLFVITGKINLAIKDSTLLQNVMDRAVLPTLRVFITNGLTGANLKSIELAFTGIGLSTHRTSGLRPADLLTQEIDFQCKHITATAKNSSSAAP